MPKAIFYIVLVVFIAGYALLLEQNRFNKISDECKEGMIDFDKNTTGVFIARVKNVSAIDGSMGDQGWYYGKYITLTGNKLSQTIVLMTDRGDAGQQRPLGNISSVQEYLEKEVADYRAKNCTCDENLTQETNQTPGYSYACLCNAYMITSGYPPGTLSFDVIGPALTKHLTFRLENGSYLKAKRLPTPNTSQYLNYPVIQPLALVNCRP
jgi:hypothetical protein